MSNPFRTNPSLGPQLNAPVLSDQAWYDGAGRAAAGAGQAMSPQTGDISVGDDGRQYMWVEVAGSAISVHATNETQVAITVGAQTADPRVTIATDGSGGWYVLPQSKNGGVASLPVGSRVWVAKGTAP